MIIGRVDSRSESAFNCRVRSECVRSSESLRPAITPIGESLHNCAFMCRSNKTIRTG